MTPRLKLLSHLPLWSNPFLLLPDMQVPQESPIRETKAPNYLQWELGAQVVLTNHSMKKDIFDNCNYYLQLS